MGKTIGNKKPQTDINTHCTKQNANTKNASNDNLNSNDLSDREHSEYSESDPGSNEE